MEQKKTDVLRDEICGRPVEYIGLCRLHYIEYLGDLIWKYKIDPIDIFNEDQLELVLRRVGLKLPLRARGKNLEYLRDLREVFN